MYSRVIQLYMYMWSFFVRFFSQIDYYRILIFIDHSPLVLYSRFFFLINIFFIEA